MPIQKKIVQLLALIGTPVCLIISPILNTYFRNVSYFSNVDALVSVLSYIIIVLVFLGIIYLVSKRFSPTKGNEMHLQTSSMIISVLLLFFYVLYAPVKENLLNLIGNGFPLAGWNVPILIIGADKIMVPLYMTFLWGFYYVVKKTPQNVFKINRFLFATSLILLFVTCFHSISGLQKRQVDFTYSKIEPKVNSSKPNIYYIILDTYARLDVLKKYDHFDNSGFINHLDSSGFYIAKKSNCNYSQTEYSLRASLNLDYFTLGKGSYGTDDPVLAAVCRKKVQVNAVSRLLINHGYTYIPIGHWFFNEQFTKNSHVLLAKGYRFTSYLWVIQIAKTPLEFFTRFIPIQDDNALRKNYILAFKLLDQAIDMSGQKFVFAHIWGPHNPYVFHSNGAASTDIQFKKSIKNKVQHVEMRRKKYIEQLEFTNKKTKEAIDKIVKTDSTAIIVLQSDHGEWTVDTFPETFEPEKNSEYLAQRMPILNTYKVPVYIRVALYDSISPVNSFRLILSKMGVTEDTLLPDKHFVVWRKTTKQGCTIR